MACVSLNCGTVKKRDRFLDGLFGKPMHLSDRHKFDTLNL